MNRLTPIIALILLCSVSGHSQTFTPIDSIDWTDFVDGTTTGTFAASTTVWIATPVGPNTDGTGVFAVQNGLFTIQDQEGTEGCPCDFDASTNCGQNDNSLFVPVLAVTGYCQVRISMTVTGSGNLECGGNPNQLEPGCPSDIGTGWEGTDAMVISVSALTGDVDQWTICGDQNTGRVSMSLDVDPTDAITIILDAGTQDVDEFYTVSNILIEGVERSINTLNLTLTTQDQLQPNTLCENNSRPIKFEVAANTNGASLQWTGPNGWTSNDASPEIATYDPTYTGTYRVTVTDPNMCPITDEIEVTILPASDGICRESAVFNIFATQCSDVILPSIDDNGVAGTWSPSDDLSLFVDSTLIFTFTPDDTLINPFSTTIEVFDISLANLPAKQPDTALIFCNTSAATVDLIDLFEMNLDYRLRVSGNIGLFDAISTGQDINDVEVEYRNFTFLGVAPARYDFFVEALAPCETAVAFTRSLTLTVIPQQTIVLNESLCAGDFIDTLGFRIFDDTLITGVGLCDTILVANITRLQAGRDRVGYPGFSAGCGDIVYFYDVFNNGVRGRFVSAKPEDPPPLGMDYDTIFRYSYAGDFILPWAAGNGCDSITQIQINLGNQTITEDIFDLCEGQDTTIEYNNVSYTISESNPEEVISMTVLTDCFIHTIRANFIPTQRDTMTISLCASQDTMIEGMLFDINNPTDVLSLAPEVGALCPSLLYVDITFDPPERGTYETSICPGETITIGGMDFNTAITAMDVWLPTPAADGCDSIVTVTITVESPATEPINPVICSDQDFTFLGVTYNASNPSGMDTVRSVRGCDSILYEINVSFFSDVPLIMLPDTTFCANASVFYPTYNVRLDATRPTYDTTLVTDNGCTQRIIFSGSVIPIDQVTLRDTICSGEVFILGGQNLNTTGMATETFTNAAGCDSIVTVELFVRPTISENISRSICAGTAFTLGGQQLTAAGNYTEVFIGGSATGCDSTVNLTLTVLDSPVTPLTAEICSGTTYDFGGELRDSSGVYRDTIQTPAGCDSILELTLTIMSPIVNEFDDSSCSGLAYPFGNEILSSAGQYRDTLMTPQGCDSIVILNLTIDAPAVKDTIATICQGDMFVISGATYTQAGTYDIPLVTVAGCDSILRVQLTVDPTYNIPLIEELRCAGQSYTVGNNVYTSTGLYTDTLQTAMGCDSIITLDLTIPDSIITPIDTFICDGQQLFINADMLETPGIHDVYFLAGNGCDSIVRVNLEVLVPAVFDTVVTLCPGQNLFVFNDSYGNSTDREITETESFTIRGTTARGCDSIVNLLLTRVAIGPPVLNRTICFNETFQVGNSIYGASGLYRDTLTSQLGCDSIVRLDLNVLPMLMDTVRPIICTAASYTIGDSTFAETGLYDVLLVSSDGCDSMVHVDLSVGAAFITNLSETICPGESFVVGNSIYNTMGSYIDTIASSAGCDSIIMLDLSIMQAVNMSLDTSICSGETLDFMGNLFTQTTTEQVIISSAQGCDSIIIDLSLLVIDEINTTNPQIICMGESVTVGDSTYSTAGTYVNILASSLGCDSTVLTIIEIMPAIESNIVQRICTGGSFSIGTSVYNLSGTYVETLRAGSGCDSIVTLDLEVVDMIEVSIEEFICFGETFDFGGVTRQMSGTYIDTLMSGAGCDSIVTLNLTIAPDLVINTDNLIGSCEGVANGSFVIQEILGATPIFAVTGLPGISEITDLPFTVTDLSPGVYDIGIVDANGCAATSMVEILADRTLVTTINVFTIDPLGMYDLDISFSGTIDVIEWDRVPGLSCYDCPDPSVDITEPTTFTVTITDIDGCMSSASISLNVNGIGEIYTPNVINPESVSGNHRFYIQGEDDSDAVYDIRIFDRWGNMVFDEARIPINDINYGWDGTWNGRPLNSGVFVYVARIYNDAGAEKMVKGDLMLYR